jgi:hypothetical protein
MRKMSLVLLVVLSGCIGYARGDGAGNVEVVTNWGTLGGAPQEASTGASAGGAEAAPE